MDFYLSDLLNDPVYNQSKEQIGQIADFVVTDIEIEHPRVTGIVVRRGSGKESVFIPGHDFAHISPKHIRLSTDLVDLQPFVQRQNEVLLVKDVYDKQIVDIDDRRLTRVNDLFLEEDHQTLRLKGVDVSSLGLIKRLRLPNIGSFLKHNVVDWEDVQFLGNSGRMKFKIKYDKLELLHPVDIARIIFEGPGYKQGSKVLSSLTDSVAAETLEELSPKLQKNLIESMSPETVAKVINHMSPYKAADLLVTLGPDMAQKIVSYLATDHVRKIQTLLNYPENSTGAYMTTEYLVIPRDVSVEELLTRIRKLESVPDFAYYIFILENELSNKLCGVVSVHDVFKAEPRTRVDAIMTKKVVVAGPHDQIKDSLKKMYRYNISALPIINKEEKLLGIVTFRDAISIFLPRRWKTRIRHVLFPDGN